LNLSNSVLSYIIVRWNLNFVILAIMYVVALGLLLLFHVWGIANMSRMVANVSFIIECWSPTLGVYDIFYQLHSVFLPR